MNKKGVEGLGDLKNIILAIVGFLALLAVFYAISNAAQAKTQEGGFTKFICTVLPFLPNCEKSSSTVLSSTLSDLKTQFDQCHEGKTLDCPQAFKNLFSFIVEQGQDLSVKQKCLNPSSCNSILSSGTSSTNIEFNYPLATCATSPIRVGLLDIELTNSVFTIQKKEKIMQVSYEDFDPEANDAKMHTFTAQITGVGNKETELCIYYNTRTVEGS